MDIDSLAPVDPSIEPSIDDELAGFFMPEAYEEFGEYEERTALSRFIDADNIAQDLTEEQLDKIGRRCYEGFQVDDKSREPWLKKTEEALKLANQEIEKKTFPWPGAANIKLPLITEAAIKFAARAYAEIIRNDKVVKGSVVGEDPNGEKQARAERVGDYMSWQLIERETEWETETDKLLHVLPIVGHMFRKRYYDPTLKRTKSELRMPDKVVINAQAANLESARRATDIIDNVSSNEIVSNIRSGIWLDVELRAEKEEPTIEKDALDEQDYFCFLEQQCWLDLDEDGYEEPYVVTFEKESMKVVRITANYDDDCIYTNDGGEIIRIKSKQIFTDYMFIPSLDGGYYGTGFGQLMLPLTKTANTIINQLLDAGTRSNTGGGYLSKEIKIRGGRQTFKVGEWKRTEATAEQLAKGVQALPSAEPSATLFNLLGLVMDLTQDIAMVKDVLAGDSPGTNVPATTVMALIEQGMKTFNAIYKRIYRSLKKEYKQLYSLNYEYLDEEEYFNVLDQQKSVLRDDFEPDSLDVVPIADPTMSSDMQRLARAEALKGAIGLPGVDPKPIIRQWMDALRIPEDQISEILPEQDPNGVPPHVQQLLHDVEKKEADINIKEQELNLKSEELEVRKIEAQAKLIESEAKAHLTQQEADAQELENIAVQSGLMKLADG